MRTAGSEKYFLVVWRGPFNPFHATGLFLYPLKTSENQMYRNTSGMKWVENVLQQTGA